MTADEIRTDLAALETAMVALAADAHGAISGTLARSMDVVRALGEFKNAQALALARESRGPVRVDSGQIKALQANEATQSARFKAEIRDYADEVSGHTARLREHVHAIEAERGRAVDALAERVESDQRLIVSLRCERLELQARINYLERTYERDKEASRGRPA